MISICEWTQQKMKKSSHWIVSNILTKSSVVFLLKRWLNTAIKIIWADFDINKKYWEELIA
jgi:hypothetical protein